MKKEWTPMPLRALKENHPKILDNFEALAKPYCTRLFDLGEEHKGIPEFIGSGTFVQIGVRVGILTNHHVAMIFGIRKRDRVYVPGYKSTKIHGLKFKHVVSLPHYPLEWEIRGVDISFIELISEQPTLNLDYQIWNLDESAERYFAQKTNFNKKGAINNWLWGVEATPSEKISKQGNIMYFKQSGFHFLGPDKPDFFTATTRTANGDLIKQIDELYCEIDRDGMDGPHLPKSYGGTSGSAVWRGIGELPNETIADFDLGGILAEEIKFIESHPATAVMCRGSCSLYDTFYKFCVHYLEHENEITALKHAGFKEYSLS